MPKSFDPPRTLAAADILRELNEPIPRTDPAAHIRDQLEKIGRPYQKLPDVRIEGTLEGGLSSADIRQIAEDLERNDPVRQLQRVTESITLKFPLPMELSVDIAIAVAGPADHHPRLHIIVGPVLERDAHRGMPTETSVTANLERGMPLREALRTPTREPVQTRIDFVTPYDLNARAIAAGAAAGDQLTARAAMDAKNRLPTDDQCLAWVAACIERAVLHELSEGFYVKGRRIFDPHGGPDGQPYMIVMKDDVASRGRF